MTEKTILSRKFQKPDDKGCLHRFEASLIHLQGNQKPYFSVTTDNGAAHDEILEHWPELDWLVALHLRDDEGAPIHTVANLLYYAGKMDVDAVKRHLLCDDVIAKQMISEIMWARKAAESAAWNKVDQEHKIFLGTVYDDASDYVKTTTTHLFKDKADDPESITSVMRSIGKTVENLTLWIRRATEEEREIPLRIIKELDVVSALQEAKLSRMSVNLLLKAWDYREAHKRITKLRTLLRSIDIIFTEKKDALSNPVAHKDLENTVEELLVPFREMWKAEAEKAKEFLKLPDDIQTVEITEESPYIILPDGEIAGICGIHHYGLLPIVDVGFASYHIAASEDEAGKAAEKYWRDMAESDSSEFAAMVGEETLIAWGMGKKAGPGSVKVSSLEQWFNLTSNHPAEVFATYDGQEVFVSINAALAEELGIDYEDTDNGYMRVVAYRC